MRPVDQQQTEASKKKRGVDEEHDKTEKQQIPLVRTNSIRNPKRTKYLKKVAEYTRIIEESSRLMAENAIMSVDMSKLTPLQKQYYTKRQQQIIDRMLAEDEAKR